MFSEGVSSLDILSSFIVSDSVGLIEDFLRKPIIKIVAITPKIQPKTWNQLKVVMSRVDPIVLKRIERAKPTANPIPKFSAFLSCLFPSLLVFLAR